jgi:hypothetical protein
VITTQSQAGTPVASAHRRLNPTIAHVRELDGSFFMWAETANALGVSPVTLRRLAAENPAAWGPSHIAYFHGVPLRLYDPARVQRLHEEITRRRQGEVRGRPRLWDDQQRAARRAAHSAAGYRRRRARALAARGDTSAAAAAGQQAGLITAGLAAQLRDRIQELAAPAAQQGVPS